ncbi:MAG: SDR family NAD(P)-dependent oxidoreductase [Rhodobacteraceae bacterium]|jgi:NAD(P)-dependent dehydrogenase (short-subunit alcohol dehydrogenase family)|nr:SDR family NAD(P)-dependent oxidoreductase [Paracoccaceae bacterium]
MLDGKVLVVTGAGLGIGRATALAAARAGARVVVDDIDAGAVDAVAAAIRDAGGQAAVQLAAIGAAGSAEVCVDRAVSACGRLDALFANAGVLRDSVLWKTEDAVFDLVVSTHLKGTFQCGRAAARQFRAQGGGGALILAGSPAGQMGNFGQTAYAAAKAGIVGMMKTWAMELARDRVAVNALIPTVLTRMTATIPWLADAHAALDRGEEIDPAHRADGIGLPRDVAPLVVYLASDAGRALSGQCLGIGGDRLAVWAHPAEAQVHRLAGGWNAAAIARALHDAARPPVGLPPRML